MLGESVCLLGGGTFFFLQYVVFFFFSYVFLYFQVEPFCKSRT